MLPYSTFRDVFLVTYLRIPRNAEFIKKKLFPIYDQRLRRFSMADIEPFAIVLGLSRLFLAALHFSLSLHYLSLGERTINYIVINIINNILNIVRSRLWRVTSLQLLAN